MFTEFLSLQLEGEEENTVVSVSSHTEKFYLVSKGHAKLQKFARKTAVFRVDRKYPIRASLVQKSKLPVLADILYLD